MASKDMKNKIIGSALATAAAIAFASVPVTSAFAECTTQCNTNLGPEYSVTCFGGNACRGQGVCKTATSTCRGNNSCRGEGYSLTRSERDCLNSGGNTYHNF